MALFDDTSTCKLEFYCVLYALVTDHPSVCQYSENDTCLNVLFRKATVLGRYTTAPAVAGTFSLEEVCVWKKCVALINIWA